MEGFFVFFFLPVAVALQMRSLNLMVTFFAFFLMAAGLLW